MLHFPSRNTHYWWTIGQRDDSIQEWTSCKGLMASLVNHSSVHNGKHTTCDQGGNKAPFSVHSVQESSFDNSSNNLECSDTPSSFGIFTTIREFLSNNFFKILIKWILWWPGFLQLLLIDLVFSEDLPNLVTVWMIRFD